MRNINGEYNSSWSKGHVYYKERQKRKHKAINLNEKKSEIPLALDGGMNDNNRTAGTVGIAY